MLKCFIFYFFLKALINVYLVMIISCCREILQDNKGATAQGRCSKKKTPFTLMNSNLNVSIAAFHFNDSENNSHPTDDISVIMTSRNTTCHPVITTTQWYIFSSCRYMMLINGKNEVFMIDRDNTIFHIANLEFPFRKDPRVHLSNTLLDGVSSCFSY